MKEGIFSPVGPEADYLYNKKILMTTNAFCPNIGIGWRIGN